MSAEPVAEHITAATFLAEVFAGVDDGHTHLFALDRSTTPARRAVVWRDAADTAGLADAAADLAATSDVWFGPATRTTIPGPGRRGGTLDCAHIGALWLDLDVAGPNHNQPGLPPTLADAHTLLGDYPLRPSAVVETGGGLQAWWLLADPVALIDAQPLLARWGATWAEKGRVRGWHVDNVFDMARVMRLPDTMNRKTVHPQPVQVTEWAPQLRYSADDLDQYTVEPPPAPTPGPRSVPYIGPERPGDALNAQHRPDSLVVALGAVYDHDSGGDRHYRAPHHDRRGETGITVYADGLVTIYSETFAADHGLQVRRPYDTFGLYTYARHGGDWTAATQALTAAGYGTRSTTPPWEGSGQVPDDPDDDWATVDLGVLAALLRIGALALTVPTVLAVQGALPLFYPGRVNSLFGESGGGKTWVMLAAAAECVRAGLRVLYIDWEDDAAGIAERLVALGLSDAQIALVDYRNPTTGLPLAMAALEAGGAEYGFVVLDSVGEAMAAQGVDSNADAEVALWFAIVKRLCRLPSHPGVGLNDHVPKAVDAPSAYAIGSQRKRAAVTGASYRVDTVREPAKGQDGLLRLTVAKDRPGNRSKGSVAAMVELMSGDGTVDMRLHMTDAQVAQAAGVPFRPTVLMGRVSDWLQLNPGSSQRQILAMHFGKKESVTDAIQALIEDGHVVTESGARGAVHHTVVVPYRPGEPFPGAEIDDRVPPRPTASRPRPDAVAEAAIDRVPSRPPLRGRDAVDAQPEDNDNTSTASLPPVMPW